MFKPDEVIEYKQTPQGNLHLNIFKPAELKAAAPGIVFFFGGGWVGGSPEQFFPQCRMLAELGMWSASAEYRVKDVHGTSPFICVEDGKSAVRWIRQHAEELGVRPDMLAAGGGSAGAHVAACSAIINDFDNPDEDAGISSKPDLLILFNPVIDTTEEGYGQEKLEGRELELSPRHNVRPGNPPTLIMQGTEDTTTPFDCAAEFAERMFEEGNKCEVTGYDGQVHGFFNYRDGDNEYYPKTFERLKEFLADQGYL